MKLGIIVSWYLGTLIIESLTYGSAGYLIFKLLKGKDKYWLVGVLITFVLFLIWNDYVTNRVCQFLELTIGNKAILDFLGEDAKNLFTTDFSDILVAFVQILVGFKATQIVTKKLQRD